MSTNSGQDFDQQAADVRAARLSAHLHRDGEAVTDAESPEPDVCEKCGGDGYTEAFNADQTDVVITLCTDCGPAPGVHDG